MAEIEELENIDTESYFVHEKQSLSNGPDVAIMSEGNEDDMSKSIPNVVQTVHDPDEVTTDTALTTPEALENSGIVSETTSSTKEPAKADENKTGNSLLSKWQRHAKGNTEGGGQSLSNDINKLSIAKTEDNSTSDRKESLPVPANLSTETKHLNDSRRDSNISNVKEGSKLSLLSSVSHRSIPIKTDFTTVQMPADDKRSVPTYEDSWIRVAIPYLPLWLAVVCLLLNILIAGSGTIISGLCIFWCAKSRVPPKFDQDPILIACVNLWVGLAQLFTVTFLLVGWFWSVAWGIRMVLLSLERRRELKEQRAIQLKQQTLSAFGKSLAMR